jgi:site-specific DNA-methyltransferase (adenine-specific)
MHTGQNTDRQPGQTKIADVIRVPVVKIEKGVLHPAMFPTELGTILIRTFCPKGGTVLDPFAGSGTTLLAASDLGRDYYGFDISDEYCEMARQRLCQQEGGMVKAG